MTLSSPPIDAPRPIPAGGAGPAGDPVLERFPAPRSGDSDCGAGVPAARAAGTPAPQWFACYEQGETALASPRPRILEVRTQILKKNDVTARGLRERFRAAGVFVVSLVSSPGAGKTTFLRETLRRLVRDGRRVAALVGDLATENDARRLAESGAPVRQIVTGTVCHLEADMVERALGDWDLSALDYLFVENVGNLVCPASFDLGEGLRLVLLSTTEGEDKPLKYPTIFNTADVAVVTKADLADAVGFDRRAALDAIQDVRPGMAVLEVSAKTGQGMPDWMYLLAARRREAGRTGEEVAAGAALDEVVATDAV